MDESELKQVIIERASDLFFQYGFANTTTQQIAEGLEISKKTLYKFFPSKDRLLDAVLRKEHIELDLEFAKIINNQDLDVFQKLMGITQTAIMKNSRYSPQFIKDMDKACGFDFEGHQKIHDQLLEGIERLMRQGVAQGIFDSEESISLVLFIVSCMQGSLTFEALTKMKLSLPEAISGLIRIMLEGTLTETARKKYLSK